MKNFSVVESKSIIRPLLRLAMPAFAEEALVLAVTWTDWWLTGHFFQDVGDETKAAMTLMGYTMWLIPSMFAAIAIGATAVIARYVGAGDLEKAKLTANQAFVVGAAIALFLTALAFFGGKEFIRLMQLDADASVYAEQYLYIVIPLIPLVMCSQVGAACLRGAGDTMTGFIAKLVVVFLNIVVSTALVTGWGFLPKVGWKGLAIGTAVGYAAGGLILLVVLAKGRAGLKLKPIWLKPNPALYGKILKIGIPGGLDIAVMLFSQMVFLALINSLGKAASAAHGLAVQIEACSFLPALAFQIAAATMVGQFLGAKMPKRASQSVLANLALGGAFVCTMGIVLYFFGSNFAYFFTGDVADPTTNAAAELLKIIAFGMPALAIVMIVCGALRGAGDTIWPFGITLLGFVGIRIPLAIYFCFEQFDVPFMDLTINGLGWGVSGAWYAMVIDLYIRAALIGARFLHGGWRRISV